MLGLPTSSKGIRLTSPPLIFSSAPGGFLQSDVRFFRLLSISQKGIKSRNQVSNSGRVQAAGMLGKGELHEPTNSGPSTTICHLSGARTATFSTPPGKRGHPESFGRYRGRRGVSQKYPVDLGWRDQPDYRPADCAGKYCYSRPIPHRPSVLLPNTCSGRIPYGI